MAREGSGYGLLLLAAAMLFARVSDANACVDSNNMCAYWASMGECSRNPDYMLSTCAKSCQSCVAGLEVGIEGNAAEEAAEVSESTPKNPNAVATASEKGGVSQAIEHRLVGADAVEVIWLDDGKASGASEVPMFKMQFGETMRMNTYLNHVFSFRTDGREVARFRVMPNRPKVVLNEKALEMFAGAACVDKHSSCPQRAARGECTSSPGWMVMMCSKSCDSCHLRDPQLRCARGALNMAQTPALVPGTLDAQFVAVASSGAYNVTVHSGPRAAFPYVAANASRDGPWVLTFENFVSDAEAEAIIKSVESKFSRSTDQGQVDQYGEQKKIVSSGRTSENAWCTGECENSQSVKTVMRRIEAITAVPTENYESFQVLRYMPGQYYRPHHDMSSADNKLACGPRIYTFFLYLSDVEEGGETEFPSLRDAAGTPLRIRPKRGSALWWPSVLSDNPTRQDSRTTHAALPVVKGIKFAANAWVHLFDYSTPNLWGCTVRDFSGGLFSMPAISRQLIESAGAIHAH